MRCWTRLVRPRSVAPHEMALLYLRPMLTRTCLLCVEHSAPPIRGCVHSFGPLAPAPASDPTPRGLATIAKAMPGCPARAGSCSILTFEPSVIVISRVCQSTV
ncbi:hypothetical protein T03_10042 [Trichinella britovi]|uniref:Uncharacterized protein n=1 Tax=Trichinella britovi TaxID=45882 RepID=A0A0V1C694_TRIBR|nr:hypothetical protein T03_10042 [Trichinella britovi]